eukprot:753779-Hanusia_phi.AAC.4
MREDDVAVEAEHGRRGGEVRDQGLLDPACSPEPSLHPRRPRKVFPLLCFHQPHLTWCFLEEMTSRQTGWRAGTGTMVSRSTMASAGSRWIGTATSPPSSDPRPRPW